MKAAPNLPANAQQELLSNLENDPSAPPDTQQTRQDGVFHSFTLLNAVGMELIWLGEENMYCLVCPEFQFDIIYEYAPPALNAGGKLEQIVCIYACMNDLTGSSTLTL